MTKCLAIVATAAVLAAGCSAGAAGENWAGYEGGHLHHNASAVDVDLSKVLWDVRFAHPVNCKTTHPGFYGSRNLVLLNGHLAVVAANGSKGFASRYAYVSILRAADGKVVNCIATTQATGPRRDQMMYPTSNYMEAYDTGIGVTILHWDGRTGILFARNGGDNPSNTAYRPLGNAKAYRGSGSLKGVGAYGDFVTRWPDFADADGNVRRDKEIPQDAKRFLDADQWDYGTIKGRFNNQPNSTAFFEVDAASGLMAAAIAPAHTQAWGYFLANKFTGQYAKRYRTEYAPGKRVFAKWGGIMVGGGRVFFMGPCDDTAGDGFVTSLFKSAKPDQGLRIAAYTVAWSDRQPNGGYTGPGAAESATLTEAFEYEFHSPHKPDSPEDAESYLELDAFHRNKAWLIDGSGVWAAWKKTQAGNVQVVHCGDKGSTTYDLGVGAGQRGQDIWPHISLATVGGRKYVAYYAGNAMYRKVVGRRWSPKAQRPLGPAALAVLDVASGKVWTCTLNAADGAGPYPSLPPNEAEGYFDRSQMVVAGRYACVAWVDVTGKKSPNAILRVLAFDLTVGKAPRPAAFAHDLSVKAGANRQTCVFDLIAADGVLYALVTESDTLNSGTHTWTAQRVIAIGRRRPRAAAR